MARRNLLLLALCSIALIGACTKRRSAPTAPGVQPGATPATIEIHMVGTAFVPHDTTVSPGDTVLWVNTSALNHTSTSGACVPCASDGLWNSGTLMPADSFRVVFAAGVDVPGAIAHVDSTGFFPYYCIPHAFIPMDGSITVAP